MVSAGVPLRSDDCGLLGELMDTTSLSDDAVAAAQKQILIDEGTGPDGLGRVYYDSLGIPTIGHGYELKSAEHQDRLTEFGYDVSEVLAGRQDISDVHAQQLFEETFAVAVADAASFLPDLATYPSEVQQVIVNMAFNLGGPTLGEFEGVRDALIAHDYEAAAREMVDSRWYEQVGDRAERLTTLMDTAGQSEQEKTIEYDPTAGSLTANAVDTTGGSPGSLAQVFYESFGQAVNIEFSTARSDIQAQTDALMGYSVWTGTGFVPNPDLPSHAEIVHSRLEGEPDTSVSAPDTVDPHASWGSEQPGFFGGLFGAHSDSSSGLEVSPIQESDRSANPPTSEYNETPSMSQSHTDTGYYDGLSGDSGSGSATGGTTYTGDSGGSASE